MKQSRFLTSGQLAVEFGVAEITVKSWRRKGTGPPWFKTGDSSQCHVLYPRAGVDEWIESRLAFSNSEAA